MDITTTDDPSKLSQFDKEIARLQIWKQLRDALKWGRLYGGAIAFMMIDGQNPATPLKLDRIRKGQFKGLMPIDRWLRTPDLQDLVDEFGPHFGKPRFYSTNPDMGGMPYLKIHYSRVIRVEGVELPYWQRISENLWGQSVLERMWDRLLAYDSAIAGVSQMMYKAHLRVLKIEGLREIIGGAGPAMRGLLANINMIRTLQSKEGHLADPDDDPERAVPAAADMKDRFTVATPEGEVLCMPVVEADAEIAAIRAENKHLRAELAEANDREQQDMSEPQIYIRAMVPGSMPTAELATEQKFYRKADYDALQDRVCKLKGQLPEGMKHCIIIFKECELGHGQLTAANWVQHGCPTCELAEAKAENNADSAFACIRELERLLNAVKDDACGGNLDFSLREEIDLAIDSPSPATPEPSDAKGEAQ